MPAYFRIESSESIRKGLDSIRVAFNIRLRQSFVQFKQVVVISGSCLASQIPGRDPNVPFTDSELEAAAKLYLERILATNPTLTDGGEVHIEARQFVELVSHELI